MSNCFGFLLIEYNHIKPENLYWLSIGQNSGACLEINWSKQPIRTQKNINFGCWLKKRLRLSWPYYWCEILTEVWTLWTYSSIREESDWSWPQFWLAQRRWIGTSSATGACTPSCSPPSRRPCTNSPKWPTVTGCSLSNAGSEETPSMSDSDQCWLPKFCSSSVSLRSSTNLPI